MNSPEATRQLDAIVVWNDSAGSTGKADETRRALESHRRIELITTASREEAISAVEKACRRRIPRVVAAGGDGTINAVVTALVDWARRHGDAPTLAILPLGTGNDLARSLQIPFDPSQAIQMCLAGQSQPLDVMELGAGDGSIRIAANMVTAGNSGKYIEVLTDELKQRWGALCYLRGAVDILEELEVFRIQLAIDDEPPFEIEALNLFFANGKTSGGGMTVCADACLSDGLFDLLVIRDGTGLDLATLTVDYLISDVRDSDLVFHRKCRRATISCDSGIPLSADGDPEKSHQFTIAIRPAAIQVVAGA